MGTMLTDANKHPCPSAGTISRVNLKTKQNTDFCHNITLFFDVHVFILYTCKIF